VSSAGGWLGAPASVAGRSVDVEGAPPRGPARTAPTDDEPSPAHPQHVQPRTSHARVKQAHPRTAGKLEEPHTRRHTAA